jgi:hypothetical protein
MLLLLASAHAASCDQAIFSKIAAPTPDSAGRGAATGEGTLDGQAAVGGRFVHQSRVGYAAWKKVLTTPDDQDEWVPDRFGYERAERIDASHLYLLFDIGLLWGRVHIKRQLVVEYHEEATATGIRTCWKMVDPTPWSARIAAWTTPDVEWERASTGWWEATPTATGTTVGYQWWTVVGQIPASVQQFGMRSTLPDLLDAFDDRAAAVEAQGVR